TGSRAGALPKGKIAGTLPFIILFMVAAASEILPSLEPEMDRTPAQAEMESLRHRTRLARDLLYHNEYKRADAEFLALAQEAAQRFGPRHAVTLEQRS